MKKHLATLIAAFALVGVSAPALAAKPATTTLPTGWGNVAPATTTASPAFKTTAAKKQVGPTGSSTNPGGTGGQIWRQLLHALQAVLNFFAALFHFHF